LTKNVIINKKMSEQLTPYGTVTIYSVTQDICLRGDAGGGDVSYTFYFENCEDAKSWSDSLEPLWPHSLHAILAVYNIAEDAYYSIGQMQQLKVNRSLDREALERELRVAEKI